MYILYTIIMVNYTCLRCGYETHIKTILIRHLSRKKKCPLKYNDIDLEKFKEFILEGHECGDYLDSSVNVGKTPQISTKLTQYATKLTQCATKLTQDATKLTHDTTELTQDTTELTQDIKKKFECKFCKKSFSRYDSLNRHLKTCKEKKEEEEVKESMTELVKLLNKQNDDLKQELKKRDEQIDELIKKSGINNSNNTINIQNNIKLLSYRDTDISHLTDNDILKCLDHSNLCIPHLIEKIHFDINKPENHNVYISNLKNNYVMIYDGIKWNLKDRDEEISNLINDKTGMIEHRLEEWIENGRNYPVAMKKFNRYLDKKENDKVLNTIKNEIKLLLYNNRSIIKTDK